MNYDPAGLLCSGYPAEPQKFNAHESGGGIAIRFYTATAIEYLPYNSESVRVAKSVAEVIEKSDWRLHVEHIGSTAVPGCWGKGIIDLLVTYAPGRLASARETLDGLGFQRQEGPETFPESRPMRVGSVEHFGRIYHLHAHVIEAGAADARNLVRFRDLLRENPALRRAYEAEKRGILARGISVSTEYSKAKGEFIRAALSALEYVER